MKAYDCTDDSSFFLHAPRLNLVAWFQQSDATCFSIGLTKKFGPLRCLDS